MSISCYCTPNSFDSRDLVNPVCHGRNWQDHRSTLSYIMYSLINNKALGQKSLNQSFWGFYFGAASKSIVAEIPEALMGILNEKGTLKKLLILVTVHKDHGHKDSQALRTRAEEVRSSRRLALSKNRGQRMESVKGRRVGHRVRRQLHRHQNSP